MGPVNIHDAKTRLSQLIDAVERGEEVTIARAGRPVARLSALGKRPKGLKLGTMKGFVAYIADDFDAPLDPSELAEFARAPIEP